MSIRLLTLTISVSILYSTAFGQITLRGRIMDSTSLQPIAFAYLTLGDEKTGTSTDIEGNFSLTIPDQYFVLIHITHVSYQSKIVSLAYLKNHPVITLLSNTTLLQEVAVSASKEENPAFRIIRQAITHKRDHDPDKLKSYEYISYNKFLVTASAQLKPFDAFAKPGRQRGMFSQAKDMRNFASLESILKTSHLFLSESVTETQKINPDKEKEKLLALKVSGFKSPLLTNVATDYQPFSFYKDNITLLGFDYINPVSKGTFGRYDFQLMDTAYVASDTIYIIKYQPKPKHFFNGLKGVLSISTDGFAIKNVIASTADSYALTSVRIQQSYEKVNGHWFPVQLNTDIELEGFDIFGKHLLVQHKSFLREIKINPSLKTSTFGDIKVDLTLPLTEENKSTFDRFRNFPLDHKEIKTYTTLDSVTRKKRWMNKAIDAMATQTVPLGLLEMDLNKVMKFNRYEAFRLGAGPYTSNRFSKWLRLGGYAGYGFRDEQWKYGGEMGFNFNLNKDFFLKFSYAKDIYETGSSHINREGQFIGSEGLRNLIGYQFDKIEFYKGEIGYRILPDVHVSVFVSRNEIQPTYNYQLLLNGELTNHFLIAETGLTLRYGHAENYMRLGGKKILIGQHFPVFTFSIAQAIPAFDAQGFNYSRFDFTAKHQIKHRYGGKTDLFLTTGWLNGLAPYGKLYNGRGARSTSLFVDNYFQTMGLYEFTATKYASIFLSHNFGNVLFSSEFSKPQLVIYHNMGIGQLDNQQAHQGLTLQSFDKGFFESGLGLNNIFRRSRRYAYYGLGGAVFYRYGPYQFLQSSDNLFGVLTASITF